MTNLVGHEANRTNEYRDIIQEASSFAQRYHLPLRLYERILAHLCLKHRAKSEGLLQREIHESLPEAIQSSISRYLFSSIIDKVYLFQGVSNDLLFQLVLYIRISIPCRLEYFPPKEDVILQNKAPTAFYILVTGDVELLVMKNGVEHVVGEVKAGDLCGEVGVLCYRPQLFTVRTKRLSQVLRLERTTFLNIIPCYIGDGTTIVNNLIQHMWELKDPIVDGVLMETKHTLSCGQTDLPLTLRFAETRGNDMLLDQLLRRGLDPNESDDNGKTALHIAASKGFENCVLLRLEFGANPNPRDSEGSVPLWETILRGHQAVTELLMANGANINAGDVGRFAAISAEEYNLNLLKEIVLCEGDVARCSDNGENTALHAATLNDNVEMVKFLMDRGADVDKPDVHGLTPRQALTERGRSEMSLFFESRKEPPKAEVVISLPGNVQPHHGTRFLGRFMTDPNTRYQQFSPRRKANHPFHGSPVRQASMACNGERNLTRVTISCLEKGDSTGRLVLLPGSLEELLEVAGKIFDFTPNKIRTKEGAEIVHIDVIRDGDHLIFSNK